MYVSNAKINIANSNINERVWKTLIDCETFLKIIPCSHGPHLAREKTATALKTSCVIYYTGELSIVLGQSGKNTATAENKGYDTGKRKYRELSAI
ncbi:hypothetical protein LOSG293_220280 [Secundilactobacillus oryzae JCM 18671]|uniref:Uncharacterized protein n=1 Tax=Secundilactobacillus oryzae JCM 18671 TaxID=1291743 RepID=A0A081BJM3_9LACO|nr:hypothetical protein LOSG293_220280 [Secundilactobacillus oryzae JCM 18671]